VAMRPALAIAAAANVAAQRNAPILCVDTCSVLDVLRGPLRPDGARTIAAADALLLAQQTGGLTLFMTSSMLPEFVRNEGNVRQELTRHLQKIDDSVEVAAECLKLCGSPIATGRLSDSTLRAQLDAKYVAIVDACEVLEDDDEAKSRAMDRVVGQRRPSRQGNGLDANIIEHYFALGRELRRLNFGHPFVFVSSNTADYCEARSTLHVDLSADFQALSLEYTSSLPWANSALGL
jgi:hypothetical protein